MTSNDAHTSFDAWFHETEPLQIRVRGVLSDLDKATRIDFSTHTYRQCLALHLSTTQLRRLHDAIGQRLGEIGPSCTCIEDPGDNPACQTHHGEAVEVPA